MGFRGIVELIRTFISLTQDGHEVSDFVRTIEEEWKSLQRED